MTTAENFSDALKTLQAFISNPQNMEAIDNAGALMVKALSNGKKMISCGNGGSMCDAMHFAQEMTGRFKDARKALPAIAISDPAHLTCVANDYGYAQVFAKYVEALGNKGDVLLAISTSGNSENVLNAIDSARAKGMHVVGLTGKDGGKIGPLCDIEIRAPQSPYADRAQEIHIKAIHCLIDYIEQHVQ